MNKNIFISIIIISFFSFSLSGQEPSNHLKKEITLDINSTELRQALPKIAEAGNFQFSYNAAIISGDSLVDISVSNQKVENVLEELLGPGITYKVLGNHVILLGEDVKKASKSDRKMEYTISGYIYDSATGEVISQASIYEVGDRLISATDNEGFYSLNLPSNKEERMVSYSKSGYNDTVIVVKPSEGPLINIRLVPKPEEPFKSTLQGLPPENVHERKLVAALVPGKAITASENIPVIEERFAQISFLPFMGSNHVVSGLITNKFSINILAGYSEGTRGVEIGGLLNINRNNMEGVQLGGFGNIVGQDSKGVQIGGFFNINAGSFTGWQIGGFSNLVMDTIRGVQLAGFSNALRGPMYGPQISGFANFTSQNVDGAQISGFTNIAVKDVKVAQITGFINIGLQDVKIAQAAGFANVAFGDVEFAQLSGFANYSNNVGGLQASGFANIVSGTNRGIQVSGFLNFAREVKGLQISIINISDTVSSGLPIGLLSFVRKGYHSFEFSTDELFYANLSFKTGVSRFYNILSAGVNDEWYRAGYGIGTQLKFSDRWKMNLDLSSSYMYNRSQPGDINGFLIKFAPGLDFRLFKFLSLTAGPTFNMFTTLESESQDLPELSFIASYPLENKIFGSLAWRRWIGVSVGIRL